MSNMKFANTVRNTFTLRDFTGGICNKNSPLRLKDNQCVDMLNISFDKAGILKKRSGVIRNTNAPTLLEPNEGIYLNAFVLEPNPSAYGYLIHTTDGFIYHSTTNVKRVIPWTRMLSTTPINGIQFLNKFYFVDGGLSIMYFDLVELETLAQPKFYHITKPPIGFTPLPSPAVKGANKTAVIAGQTYPHYNAWYEPCALELADGFKGANMCEVNPTFIQVHGDRMYVSGNNADPNMIYIADVLNPQYFPASLPIQTPPTGDKVTGLHVFSDALVIGRRDSVYALFGNTNRTDTGIPYELKHISTHTGIANQNCVNTVNDYLFYVGTNGQCYKMQIAKTNSSQLLSTQLNTDFDFTLPPLKHSVDEIRNCHSGYDPVKNEWYIQLNNDTVVYNYTLMAWTRYNNIASMKFITIDNKFYITKSNGAFYMFDESINHDTIDMYGDFNIPISSYWQSKTLDFGSSTRIKQIRDTYLVSESWDNNISDIEIKYEVDYVDIQKKSTIKSDIPIWGTAEFDNAIFSQKNIVRSIPIMVGRRGRTFTVILKTPYEYGGVFQGYPGDDDTINMPVGTLIYFKDALGGLPNGWHIRTEYNLETHSFWADVPNVEYYFQPLKLYELNGIYELKGYR